MKKQVNLWILVKNNYLKFKNEIFIKCYFDLSDKYGLGYLLSND